MRHAAWWREEAYDDPQKRVWSRLQSPGNYLGKCSRPVPFETEENRHVSVKCLFAGMYTLHRPLNVGLEA